MTGGKYRVLENEELSDKVSISTTFEEQIFHTKVFLEVFRLYSSLGLAKLN